QSYQKASTTTYSKPRSPAMRENSFMPSGVRCPPSIQHHAARPGLVQSAPSGKNPLSGGGERLVRMSQFTSVFKSAPTITTRQGVVMVPVTDAGFASSLAYAAE